MVKQQNNNIGAPHFYSVMKQQRNNNYNLIKVLCEFIDNIIKNIPYPEQIINKNIPDIKFNDNCGVSIRIVNKIYDESVLAKNKYFERPILWPVTGNIILSHGSRAKLLNSLVSVEGQSIEAASDQLYNFLKTKFMGDFVYRTDIGYLK